MSKIFPKINLKFYYNVTQLTTKLINRFSYSITTHFIPSNKDCNSCCNPYSVYQMCPKSNY